MLRFFTRSAEISPVQKLKNLFSMYNYPIKMRSRLSPRYSVRLNWHYCLHSIIYTHHGHKCTRQHVALFCAQEKNRN
jgi:hypothetical protein